MADKPPTEVTVEEPLEQSKEELIEVPQKEPDKKEEPKYVTLDDLEKLRREDLEKIKKQVNGLSYLGRQFQEFSKKLDSMSRPAVTAKPESEKDDWDKKLETNWRGTVEELAELKIQEILAKREREAYFQQQEQAKVSNLNRSKMEVLQRYPELQDNESEVTHRYQRIMQEHPEWLSNEQGPLLTMYAMEDSMKKDGVYDKFTRQVIDKEASRRARVDATSMPKGVANSKSGKSYMTKEDLEFCTQNNIDPVTYNRNKERMAKSREGLEIE